MTRIRRNLIYATIATIACLALLSTRITFDFHDDIDGFFLLHGENGAWYELADDLTPEDTPRLIIGMPLYPFKKVVATTKFGKDQASSIDFRWDKKDGRGFIRNNWRDGSKLIINLGRFRDSNGKYPAGLFIGGGLPPSDPDYQHLNNDETGMTYFDGKRWFHIWCNVNEGIVLPSSPFKPSYPSDWEYRGSWIRENNGTDLTIECKHRMILAGVPLDMDRTLFYTNGNKFVILATRITNHGNEPSTIQYLYGDEPWVGNFGSSAGDVGWTDKELLFTERSIDVTQNNFIGMFDYGNPLAGEDHNFTGKANFLEWDSDHKPDKAYVSNFSGGVIPGPKHMPLISNTNRFIAAQWGPRTINPGESLQFTIAVGMADINPKTGMPVKPETVLNR
jgi:hypothetical protein